MPVLRSTSLAGLTPATGYRYRLVATDVLIAPQGKTVIGPTASFRTFATGAGALADERAWELVSPAQKNSAQVAVPGFAGGTRCRTQRQDPGRRRSGEALTYTSFTSFGDPLRAAGSSQYLSKRTAAGWGTENISPFGASANPVRPPYLGFSSDLRFGAFVIDEPPLTAEAQPGFQNLYLRDNATGGLQALTVEAPQPGEGEGFCVGYGGASADGTHAIFTARGAMADAPTGKGFSLYEWSAAAGLKLVSVLPDGTSAPPVKASELPGNGTGFGAEGGNCDMDQGVVRHAISADGSTIFWSYAGKYKSSEHPLLARIGASEIDPARRRTRG